MCNRKKMASLYDKQKGKCIYCKRIMNTPWVKIKSKSKSKSKEFKAKMEILAFEYATNELSPTLEHLHPSSTGGVNNMSNFAATCNLCNTLKADIHHDMFKYIVNDEDSLLLYKYRISQIKLISKLCKTAKNVIRFKCVKARRLIKHYQFDTIVTSN